MRWASLWQRLGRAGPPPGLGHALATVDPSRANATAIGGPTPEPWRWRGNR